MVHSLAAIDADPDGNKSETYTAPPALGGSEAGCAFILDADTGHRCGAPAVAGSVYCRRHRALCLVRPESPEGGSVIRQFERDARPGAVPPAELAHLASVPVPEELDSADEPRDLAGCIDLVPQGDERGDE